MSGDLLTVFPPNGVDQTIHVAILIGVVLLLVLTESFGWVFSGLVVPGYLASLFVLEPASGVTVMFEAILTFVFARLVSDVVARSGAWSSFFGRERFLLLIFISISVRQASELWLLPDVLQIVDDQIGTTYHLTHTFSSVGLVLVPLTANMFWKLDLRRGLIQIGVPTALTFAILYFVLLPYTNLSFARLEITYENVALDFMSSPKAYILLVVGAHLASRYNLLYGWDYAGILVPALLTLAWMSPFRLVTTLVETLLLVVVVRAIISLPGIRTMNLEGPRKVALVFTVSFFVKWGLGWIVGPTISDLRVTDLFGFGYLLSSLLAVKILQKGTVARIAVPTFVVSVIALVVGSAVGFGLDQVAPTPQPAAIAAAVAPMPATTVLLRTARGVLALGHVRARLDVAGDVPIARTSSELDRYRALWAAIAAWLEAPSDPARREVELRAVAMGLALRPIEPLGGRQAWALFELEERLVAQLGWDTAVLVPAARGPIIAVPRPASEEPTAEVAASLCERIACRAVVVSGIDTSGVRGTDADRAAHGVARRALGHLPAIELRADLSLPHGRSVLHVANGEPEVNVSALWPRGLELSWKPAVGPGDHWGAQVLRANPEDYWHVVTGVSAISIEHDVSIEAWFAQFFERVDPPAASGPVPGVRPSTRAAEITHAAPSQSELRFVELMIAKPALAGANLGVVHAMATLVGYGVHILGDGVGPARGCWIVAEETHPRRLGWGVLAGRVEVADPVAIEIPRPRREIGTWRLGVELWRSTKAGALIVADGDVPDDRLDADPAATWNTTTVFQAFHQAAHDALRRAPRATILQIRGFGVTQPIPEPAVVTLLRPALEPAQLPDGIAAILHSEGTPRALRAARIYDGARDLIDVNGTGNPQLQYCSRFETVTCALLWFSEAVRDDYRDGDHARSLAQFTQAGLAVTPLPAHVALLEPALAAPDPGVLGPPGARAALKHRFDELAEIAQTYASERNVQLLRRVTTLVGDSSGAIDVRGGYSEELGRPFLVLEVREGDHVMRGLVFVPSSGDRIDLAGGIDAARLAELLARRPRIITLTGRAMGASHGE